MGTTAIAECPDGRKRAFHTRAVVWSLERPGVSSANGYVYAEHHRVYGRATLHTGGVGTEDGGIRVYFTPKLGKWRELVLAPLAPGDGIETLDEATAVEEAVAAFA